MAARTKQEEAEAIDIAFDMFMGDCRARLHEMVALGKTGWDDPLQEDAIKYDLYVDACRAHDHGDRHHLNDIANRAMMLWWLKWGIPICNTQTASGDRPVEDNTSKPVGGK